MTQRKTIGIIGAGQLGGMLKNAANKFGFEVVMLEDFKNKEKIIELGKICDFVTFEIESANLEGLEELVKQGISVRPDPKILKIIKDKFGQKVFLKNHDISVGEFALIENREDCVRQGEIWDYPFLLKARFDAYDGRGNFVIRNKDDIDVAFDTLKTTSLYAEKFVDFTKELAVVSARDIFNNVESFDVVETIHKNNICHIVRSPADVSEEIKLKARNLARQVLESLSGVGVFAVEMFLTREGEILVNEIAPRVHNSGHHTIEAYSASQFEQHIRAITGMPLLKPEMQSGASVMVNILGEREGQAEYKEKGDLNGVNVHIYGKMETRKERKMGHLTVLADTVEEAEEKAKEARKNISI